MYKSKTSRIILLLYLIIVVESLTALNSQVIRVSQNVRLKPIGENVWIHVSDMEFPKWGKVSANGLVVLDDNQLVLIDTPWNGHQTQLLIQWFKKHDKVTDIKVIVSHYHDDNLGGLDWVHQNGFDSYSIKRTQEICEEKGLPKPMYTLDDNDVFEYCDILLEIHFLGEGHTEDSICVYLPDEKILFGGCSVKALKNSRLGNISDANIKMWPFTLRKMKNSFPEVKMVIPGHGQEGPISLIDHTLSLFNK